MKRTFRAGRFEEAAKLRDEIAALRRAPPTVCSSPHSAASSAATAHGEGGLGGVQGWGEGDDTTVTGVEGALGGEEEREAGADSREEAEAVAEVRVGVVSTMLNPRSEMLEAWLKYHYAIGFHVVLLFLDNPSDVGVCLCVCVRVCVCVCVCVCVPGGISMARCDVWNKRCALTRTNSHVTLHSPPKCSCQNVSNIVATH